MNTKKVILRRDILKKTTKEIHSFDSDYLNQEFCLITPEDSNVCNALEESFKSWSGDVKKSRALKHTNWFSCEICRRSGA